MIFRSPPRQSDIPLVVSLHPTSRPQTFDQSEADVRQVRRGFLHALSQPWRKKVLAFVAGALCVVGLGLALAGGGNSSSTVTEVVASSPSAQSSFEARQPTNSVQVHNSVQFGGPDQFQDSPAASVSIDPREVVLQLRSSGQLGSDTALWQDASASVLSRNGDVVLIQLADGKTGATRAILLVRSRGEWMIRKVSTPSSR